MEPACLINDYRNINAKNNVEAREIVIKGWSHVFVVAVTDIKAGAEVLLDYGSKWYVENPDADVQNRCESLDRT